MLTRWVLAVCVLVTVTSGARAQRGFSDALPKEEFAERRARVMEVIGDGVAIVQGAAEYPGLIKFRQNNQFFYLTGVELPRAILVIDGRAKRSTLYLQPRDEQLERMEGPVLVGGEEAARVIGVEQIVPRDEFAAELTRLAQGGRSLYVPFQSEALAGAADHRVMRHESLTAADPWDGRPSREATFVARIRAQAPQFELRNLDPILNEMRAIKSPREIALVRQATRIAGLAITEVMRSASVGMYEYELEALGDYFFKKHNAHGPAHFALVAAGENAFYGHYHAAQSRLEDGDLILYDYNPDYHYYTSDVARMFPANGRFSADQMELYTVYLRLYQALLQPIRPGATQRQILDDAVPKMDGILASYRFASPAYRDAAVRFVDELRGDDGYVVSHYIGMEVSDPGYPSDVLRPGMIFAVEPVLRIPEGRIYIRLEDTILITETGYENLSSFVPIEVEDIERVMAERGVGEEAP